MIAFFALQLARDRQERAIERGAIISGQFDQPCLHDQAAQLDQMPRAFPALDDPFAHVGSCLLGFKPMRRRPRAPLRLPAPRESGGEAGA